MLMYDFRLTLRIRLVGSVNALNPTRYQADRNLERPLPPQHRSKLGLNGHADLAVFGVNLVGHIEPIDSHVELA